MQFIVARTCIINMRNATCVETQNFKGFDSNDSLFCILWGRVSRTFRGLWNEFLENISKLLRFLWKV